MSASTRVLATSLPSGAGDGLFRLMAEQWPGAVIALDRDLRVLWANARAQALIGGRSRRIRHSLWSELGLPWPLGPDQQQHVLDGARARLDPALHTGRDGSRGRYGAELMPLAAPGEPVSAILCLIQECADEEDTQEQAALTHAQVGSWHWDFENLVFTMDSRWCQAMNVDPCSGPDHLERWAREMHPDDVAEFRRKCEAIRAGRVERFEVEYRMLAGDSRWLWVLQRGHIVDRHADGRAQRIAGICIEIDDRKRAEVALQENEARLATALWGARAAFWQWHVTTDVTVMSPLWFAMTGYTREQWESVPNSWLSRIHPDERERVETQIRQHLAGQSPSIEVEYRIRAANGDWKWMLTRGRAVEWDFDGNATSAIGVSLDIDVQKRAERELRTTEARLETAVWGAGMGLWEMDFRTESTRWFSDWCDRLDLHPCEGNDHVARWDANIHPEDVGEAARRFSDHVAGNADYYDAEYRIKDKKGRWRWLFERGRVVERKPDGSALRMVGVCMDIDERKEAELEFIRSQRRLEVALESARGGMWDWDHSKHRARYTEFFFRMLGVPPQSGPVEDEFWTDRVHAEDLPRVRTALQDVLEGRNELYEAEYRLRHADGSWRWVLDRGRVPERDESGKATRMVGFLVDITDRVRTQEALRRSEFRYRSVASVAPGYIFEYRFADDGDVTPVWVSDGIQAVFGASLDELMRHGGWSSYIDPEWLPVIEERRARVREGIPQSGEVRVRTANGTWKWLHVSALPVTESETGRVTGVLGSAYDITTRKLAEQAVRDSEATLRAVTENTPDWLFLIDENLRVRFANRPFGQYSAESMVDHSLLEFTAEAHRPSLEDLYRRVLETGHSARLELRHPNADGSSSHYEHRVAPVLDGTTVRALTVVVTDVTERKRAETALLESQTTLQTVAQSSADWLALFDRQRKCVFLNRPIRGLPPEAWIGAPVEDFAPPGDRKQVHQIFEHVMNTGEPRDFDQVLMDPKRGPRYLELRARAVQTDGRIFGAVVNISEVTERHNQQETLRTNSRILETMREGVVLVDSATHIIRLTNPTFDLMFGYTHNELLGKQVDPLFSMPPAQRKRFERSVSANALGEVPQVEFECVRRDGTRFVAACVITPLSMSGRQHWLAVLNDVTERKRLEREIIEIANREQQRIGGDLHDGLGQELTGIALMLRGIAAQLRKEGSGARLDVEDVIGLVNNAIESTRSLARGLSPVSAERGGLAAALQALAARASERYSERYGVRVTFKADLDTPLRLSETAATHLYRITQEALTNVIRHSRATQVSIRLEVCGEELQLRIDDNGRGFAQPPGDFNTDTDAGLGLKIMRYRAQMLGGDLVLESGPDGGASVRCSCPLEPSGASDRNRVPPAGEISS